MIFIAFNPETDGGTPQQIAAEYYLGEGRTDFDTVNYTDHTTARRGIYLHISGGEVERLNAGVPDCTFHLTSRTENSYRVVRVECVSPEVLEERRLAAERMDTVLQHSRDFGFASLRNNLFPLLAAQPELGILKLQYNTNFRDFPLHRGSYTWSATSVQTVGATPNLTQIFFGLRPKLPNPSGGSRGASLEMFRTIPSGTDLNSRPAPWLQTIFEWGNGVGRETIRGEMLYGEDHDIVYPICYRMFHPVKALYWFDGGYKAQYGRTEFTTEDAQRVLDMLTLPEEDYMRLCSQVLERITHLGQREFARLVTTNLSGNLSTLQKDAESRRGELTTQTQFWQDAKAEYEQAESRLAFHIRSTNLSAEDAQAQVLERIESLSSLDMVDTCKFTFSGLLEVVTEPLTCHSDHSGNEVWKNIGQVKIIIDPKYTRIEHESGSAISLYNVTHTNIGRNGGGSCHDYFRPGGTCWGDAGRTVDDLLKSGDIEDLVIFIINFIESPPGSDGYGRFDAFPTIDPPS